MRVPLGIVGAALLYWGACTDVLALAFPIAVLAVGPRFLRRRFDFATAEFHRALDLCWLLFLGGILLVYGREAMGNVLRTFARWLPLVFAPALLAQVWSGPGRLPLSAVLPLPWWRRQADLRVTFDAVAPYVVLCLLAASAVPSSRTWFYAGLLGVSGALLWSNRPVGTRPWGALAVLALSAAAGWRLADRIGEAQQALENRFLTWVTQFRRDEGANRMARTSIGRSGAIGGSSRVVLKVRSGDRAAVPERLRVAAFSGWRAGVWYAPLAEFEPVEAAGDEWRLQEAGRVTGSVQVEWVRELTGGLLALPHGTLGFGDLPVDRVERTPVGAVRAVTGAGVVAYRADFGEASGWESPPSDEDRVGVPYVEQPALTAVIEDWELTGRPPEEILDRLGRRFTAGFRYSTTLEDVPALDARAATPVGRFLLGHRTGHCEFFATAAVLLLRQAGVPARYATGYLVAAAEAEGDVRVVRERHAHAWVLAWIDGAWREFDPTPPGALEFSGEPRTWSGRWGRFWSDLRFSFSRWWWLGEKRLLRHLYWAIVPLLALLLWRLRRVREVIPGVESASALVPRRWPGQDSEWFAVAAALDEEGWDRGPREAPGTWQRRLEREGWSVAEVRRVVQGVRLHDRLRFDPRGLDDAERSNLRAVATEVLGRVSERRRQGQPGEASCPSVSEARRAG